MQKIVFVHLFNDRSGSPKVLSQVIRTVDRLGIPIEILTSSDSDGFLSNLPGKRTNIFYRRSETKIFTLLYYLASQICYFLYSFRYWRDDCVFYINTMMPCGAALAAWLMRKQVTYHIHETSVRPRPLKVFLRLIVRLTASKILFVSHYLKATEGFQEKNQFVIHNAHEENPYEQQGRLRSSEFNVLMICSLKTYKGIFEFIKIAETLQETPLVQFKLILNATIEELKAWFSTITLPNNITLLARQSNVSDFYRSADLLLNLSHPDEWIETFGLTILEGMAYGVPVIAPPIGGPAEIVTHGQDGYLISCYEYHEISKLILNLSQTPHDYKRLSLNAKKRSKDFSIERFETDIINIFTRAA